MNRLGAVPAGRECLPCWSAAARAAWDSYRAGLTDQERVSLASDITVTEDKARALGYGDSDMEWILPWHLDAFWKRGGDHDT